MATSFILTRKHQDTITREMFIERLSQNDMFHMYVSDDDREHGKTIHDDGVSIGVECGSVAWFSFYDGHLCSVDKYGATGYDCIDEVGDVLGVTFVCEHDDDFPYHNFPVDVNTVAPMYAHGEWRGYLVGGTHIVPTQTTEDGVLYYEHIWGEHTEGFDFEKFLEEWVYPTL